MDKITDEQIEKEIASYSDIDKRTFRNGFKCGVIFSESKQPKPEKSETAESEYYPGVQYQELFEYMLDEHNVTLLQSELDDLILIVQKFLTKNPNY